MKILHYHIYNKGNVGMCNILMSLENALIIAKLTNREKIVFYLEGKKISNSKKSIFELYDINFNIEVVYETDVELNIPKLKYSLGGSLFYYKDYPNKNFINERVNLLDLSDYESLEEFGTLDDNTLSFYSYLFYLGDRRGEINEWLKRSLPPKNKYLSIVNDITDKHCSIVYNSVHIRRGDYLEVSGIQDKKILDFLDRLKNNFAYNIQLLVHTDENDKDYFLELTKNYNNLIFIDDIIRLEYSSLDRSEVGLISLLIASHSNNFVGTMMSTFTSFIQRYRLYNNKIEEFKFLYPQNYSIKLDRFGRFFREPYCEYIWGSTYIPKDLKDSSYWFREWEGSYKQPLIQSSVEVFPNFLEEGEISFILGRLKNNTQFFERENRDRVILRCKDHKEIKELFIRSCQTIELNISSKDVEDSYLQVFIQYSGGETFWHMDSLATNEENEVRSRSILFYLNDDFSGSELSFPYIGLKLQPKRGVMITYPLLNEYLEMNRVTSHSASLVTKGTKIMCYFDIKRK